MLATRAKSTAVDHAQCTMRSVGTYSIVPIQGKLVLPWPTIGPAQLPRKTSQAHLRAANPVIVHLPITAPHLTAEAYRLLCVTRELEVRHQAPNRGWPWQVIGHENQHQGMFLVCNGKSPIEFTPEREPHGSAVAGAGCRSGGFMGSRQVLLLAVG